LGSGATTVEMVVALTAKVKITSFETVAGETMEIVNN
jgi:hypothetical protein